jgi:prevent-host-death family protein
MVVWEVPHEEMAAGFFKANCLVVVDEVQAKHNGVVITKHGKPVAKLVPLNTETTISLQANARLPENIVSPAIFPEGWADLK